MVEKALIASFLHREGRAKLAPYSRSKHIKTAKAFTLAEVLITLGIIGVVAALTMPGLIASIQDKVLEAQAKKAENRLANGYQHMMALYEIFDFQNLPITNADNCDKVCLDQEHKKVFEIINDNVFGTLKPESMPEAYSITNASIKMPGLWDSNSGLKYMFMTKDGFVYGLFGDNTGSSSTLGLIVDVNGTANPNTISKDLHMYTVSGNSQSGFKVIDISDEIVAPTPAPCEPGNTSRCTAETCRQAGGVWTMGGSLSQTHYYCAF